MKSSNGFTVEIEEINGLGATWIVRSYRKIAFWRRRLSSDWFLNGDQANKFAQQLLQEFETDPSSSARIQARKPGWTLRRPSH
jgi:hypothetical protein